MIEISKELLSEVLKENVLSVRPYIDNDPFYKNIIMRECRKNTYDTINIYELADTTIDWIESQGYWIKKEHKDIYQLIYKGNEVYGIDTKKRIDVPFMCAEWILNNKSGSSE